MKLTYLIAVLTCVIALLGTRTHAQDTTQTAPSDLSQSALDASRTLATQSELASIAKAQEVRSALLTTPPADAATCEQLRTELRELVLKAFLDRLELQVMEVKSLQQKAQQMQTKLEQRQANHSSIIDRRMEELLSPDLNWDAELASALQPTSPQSSSMSTDRASWLERLQGKWDLTIHHLQNQESKSDSYTAVIEGSQFRIAKPDGSGGFTPQELQFLEGTTPQQLDLRSAFSPDELAEISGKQGLVLAVSTLTPAIIEQSGEAIRICATTGINQSRPDQFVVGANSCIYELRRPTATDGQAAPTDPTVTTEIYHVGSIVTGSLFSKGIGLLDEKYTANQEAEIEKEMQSLIESIIGACSSPPAMIKALTSQRKLIARHTPEGQQEIANLLTALGNPIDSVDRKIRLRIDYVNLETILEKGIKLTGRHPTAEQADIIRKLFKGFSDNAEWSLDPQDQVINSGAGMQFQLESSGALPLPVYARIMPGTQDIQLRLDLPQSDNRVNRPFLPFSLVLKEGESILVPPVPDSESWHFLVTANIVTDATDEKSRSAGWSSNPADSLAYQGKPVTYWLDAYWAASTPNEKTEATNGARLTSTMAIAEFRERPECDAAILQAMTKWTASVENELSPNRLHDVAECIMHVGGKRHQMQAIEHLFRIADRMPAEATMDWYSMNFLTTVSVTDGQGEFTIKEEFKNLSFTNELFTLLAKNLSSGTSKQRLFAYVLLMAIGRDEETRDDKPKTVREAWQQEGSIVLEPAFLAASEDENEEVRSLSALFLAHPYFQNPRVRERLIAMIESDPSSTVRCYALSIIAGVASAADSAEANSLSSELVSCLTKAVRNDSSNDVKSTALNALTQRGLENELVHQTLMEWAVSEDPKIVNLALDSLYNGSTNGKRPQSVDELMELLSDPAWGIKIEVNRNNFSKHHRWARQYAIAVLGQYDSMALSVLPILETELANKETATFAREAIDRISGYCSDLPLKSLQGKWRVAVGVSPAGQAEMSPLLPLKAGVEEADRIVEITGTQLLKDGKCIGHISHARGSSQQVVQIVIVGELEQLRLSGSISPEDDGTVRDQYQLRLRNVPNSAQQNAREDLYELHRVECEVGWSDFLQQLPVAGTALVMVDDQSETSRSMQPIAKQVADAASVQLVTLPLSQWPGMFTPSATHFVLMKDRQLVGTRSGLMTGQRLHDFVDIAAGWLTPQATGVKENSLVRIDCYINPGKNNIGSQHGGTYPLTTAVVAVCEDQALLLGPDGIAGYIEKGYACEAIVYDESGREKQLPLDVVQIGPVKLIGQDGKTSQSAIEAKTAFEEGSVISDPELAGYLKSATEPLEAYETGRAIYHIRGAHGLTPVTLAAVDYLPTTDQPVLSGGFNRSSHFLPIVKFGAPIHWQSQLANRVDDGPIYGGNLNGPELFDVLCPTTPAPFGFTFNELGQLIGSYALGDPTQKDPTHSVFLPNATHSILRATLEQLDDGPLKSALEQNLNQSP